MRFLRTALRRIRKALCEPGQPLTASGKRSASRCTVSTQSTPSPSMRTSSPWAAAASPEETAWLPKESLSPLGVRAGPSGEGIVPWIRADKNTLRILNCEMEATNLFKIRHVYGFAAACVCGVIAQRTRSEQPVLEAKAQAVDRAIRVALAAAEGFA